MRHSTSVWVRLYRTILFLYPLAVRRQFGADMADCFDDLRQRARRSGRLAEMSLVIRTYCDMPRSAIKAHA